MACGCTDNKLNLDSMKNLSIDEIINLYRQGYRLEDIYNINKEIVNADKTFSSLSLLSPLKLESPKIGGLSPANCPTTNVIQGTQKTITIAFPGGVAGGVSPYIYHFYRDGTEIHTSSPTTVSSYQFQYTFNQTNGDTTGSHRYLTNVTDNCSIGSQRSGDDWCDITIQAASTVGNVTFHTNPAGAHIMIGGADQGVTTGSPTDGILTLNNTLVGDLAYDVTLIGYNPSTGNHVTVVAGQTVNAPLVTLTQIIPGTGAVAFHTNPGQAQIWKGTTLLCTTDLSGVCTATGQPEGTLNFIVKKVDYIDSTQQNVTVVADTTTSAALVTLVHKTGSVKFRTSPGGADIWSGTDLLGTTATGTTGEVVVPGIATGSLFFIAKKVGYVDSAQQSITVIENTTTTATLVTLVQIVAGKGSIVFHTNPGQAQIWVGNTNLGSTDNNGSITVGNLNVGLLTFIAKKVGYEDSPPTYVTVVEATLKDAPTVILIALPVQAGGGGTVILAAAAIGIAALYMMRKPKLPGP